MENFMYFIKIDNHIIKFGISSDLHRRIRSHYNKFVNQLHTTNDLEILNIIRFKNKELNKETEKRLKKCIRVNNKFMKEYDETELFHLDEYDHYTKKYTK